MNAGSADQGASRPAAGRAGFEIRALRGPAELSACVRLQEATWGPGFTEAVPPMTLELVQQLGGVLAGAFDPSGELIGFVFGMLGMRHGEIVHWSDMMAVRADRRDQGVGAALKRHQRQHVLHQGIGDVCWTFDPLEARNAHFNFARLGVTSREYVRDFYAGSESPLHSGIGTDRLVAVWDVASERVERRLAGRDTLPSAAETTSLPLVNALEAAASPRLYLDDPVLRLAIPPRVQELKRADPQVAMAWRASTRTAFEHYLERGYIVREFVRVEDAGWYLLARD